ncbi:DUF4383 domain-containing protein [Modestobacter sp. NPDC049651]|uniref:DUF4383 domain-containing protein n=1 Tax=unclassified Modestobacter TaxID=2643866 RepID=UPI00340DEBF3
MKLTVHRNARQSTALAPGPPPAPAPSAAGTGPPTGSTRLHRTVEHAVAGGRVYAVQRIGAVTVSLVLLVFGVLGLTGGAHFFTTRGERVLGMSSNGLLSVLSVVAAVALTVAVWRGPRRASTAMIAFGVLFFLSAVGNLAVLRTGLNVLAFGFSNIVFSVAVGFVLLVLGCYGRVSGNLPADSPYAHPRPVTGETPDSYPSTPAEFAVEAQMREAEIAVVEHCATAEQLRRVRAMAQAHTRAERRRIWTAFDHPADR